MGGSTYTAFWPEWSLNISPFTDSFPSLKFRRHVTSLSSIDILTNNFSESANCMPRLLLWPRRTQLSTKNHPFIVYIYYARVNQHHHSSVCYSLDYSLTPIIIIFFASK